MVGKLGLDDRLEQDNFEGVDEDEWVSTLPFFNINKQFAKGWASIFYSKSKRLVAQPWCRKSFNLLAPSLEIACRGPWFKGFESKKV